MAAYLEACIEEANGDAAFIAKALGEYRKGKRYCLRWREMPVCLGKACIRLSPGKEVLASIPSLK